MNLLVGVVDCELYIPGAQGLKEKRKVVRSIIDKMNKRFKVSALEIDLYSLHQSAQIGIAFVCKNENQYSIIVDSLREIAEGGAAIVTKWYPDLIEIS